MLENYFLDVDEWKYDKLPEIMDGKNVYDFIDPDIEAKLNALEEEEERLEGEGFYDSDDEIVSLLPPNYTLWPSRLPCLTYAYDRWTTKRKKS